MTTAKKKGTQRKLDDESREVASQRASAEEYQEWYDAHRPTYERLVETAVTTLKGILDSEEIPYLNIYGRAKSRKSFLEKITRKPYKNPKIEIPDFAGTRVIVYRRSDVVRVGELITASFGIDTDRSADKSVDLGVDRVGYRSVHFICRCGTLRDPLPEFGRFNDLVFEVQVRTVLEHAWAEIEHANYKLGAKLPDDLQRRLRLAAGLLESADRELDALAQSIDEYGEKVQEQIERGELSAELNGITLVDYITKRFPYVVPLEHVWQGATIADLIEELRNFGTRDLRELASLLDNSDPTPTLGSKRTILGLVRRAMMLEDARRYFDDAWGGHWQSIKTELFDELSLKYGDDVIKKILAAHNIQILEEVVEGHNSKSM